MIKSGLKALCLSGALLAGNAGAESPPPFPDFKAKRVKAPPKGALPKIDVQITVQDTVVTVAKPAETVKAGKTGSIGKYGWFWEQVSPEIGETGDGRLEPALKALSAGPAGRGVKAPRLQALSDIARTHGSEILIATVGTQVSPALVLAMISVESGGNSEAVSRAGAQGLMQLMPVTSERFDVEDPFDSADNIGGGVAFLDVLMTSFERDPILVLAGYNAGENAVRKAQGVPEYPETRDYVPKVLAAYSVARGLCRTPPELITDGCVFALN